MSYKYPHERRRILAISGIFDDFSDDEMSLVRWFETWKTGNMQWNVVAAPGGVGGNALWLKGTIGDGIGMQGKGHLSPYPNTSNMYLNPPSKPFRIKNRAEFRMRIAEDQTSPLALLSHAAGFVLDGAVKWTDDHNERRTGVYFSVANQRCGITSGVSAGSEYDVAWAGVIDTWYNIRIEWEWDWFDNVIWIRTDWERDQQDKVPPASHMKVYIKVYINNSLVIDQFIYKGEWRDTSNLDFPQSMDLGRAGIGLSCENDDTGNVSNGTFVEVYFKDILITQDIKLINWEFVNSVIYRGAERTCTARVACDFPDIIQRGQDIQIYARNRTSDDWTGQFRGKIRQASRESKTLVNIDAEGYDSVLAAEKSEVLSFVAKTAQEIIDDAVNIPDVKPIFDVTTFFDAAATTYNRDYVHLPKLDIMMEMAVLENFVLYLDMANAWHFEKYSNSRLFTDIHFAYGAQIGDYTDEDLFLRAPNILRVFGSGVMAERNVAAEQFTSGSTVIREINRLDLTTQAEVDDALDYYISSYLEPVKIISFEVFANYKTVPSKFIKVTIPELGYNYQLCYVMSVSANYKGTMRISCVKFSPDISAVIADLNYRQGSTEGEGFTQDLVTDTVEIEGIATMLVGARFYITEYYGVPYSDRVVVREGNAVVTNRFLDDLNDLFLTTDVPSQPAQYEYIHWGTGTTPAQEDDTGIETAQHYEWIMPYVEYDGTRRWGNGASASTELGTVIFRLPSGNIGAGQTFTNITELTLQQSTSPASKTAVRCTFPAYEPAGSGKTTVEIVIAITIRPQPGACYPTTNWLGYIGFWLRDLSIVFKKINRIAFLGTDTFTCPSIWLEEETEGGGILVTCPALAADVSLTTTQLKDRFMIKYEQTYTFDYADRYDPGDGDQLVAWIGASSDDNSTITFINMFFRTQKLLSDYDTFTTKLIIWLKFARGDVDIRDWLCVPRIEEGDCI